MEVKLTVDKKKMDEIVGKFNKMGPKAEQEAYRIVRAVTDKLLDETIKREPVDEGFLNVSTERKVEPGSEESIVIGHVFIPTNSAASEYAMRMHEGLYNLGPKSMMKQMGQAEIVGRKYMERAFAENEAKLAMYIKIQITRFINAL